MATQRNIGGSILPSGGAHVYKPIALGKSELAVVPSESLDTHFLVIRHTFKDHRGEDQRGQSILASHPNGHSCLALAERMVAGDIVRVESQRTYIQDCGGLVRPLKDFEYHISNAKE